MYTAYHLLLSNINTTKNYLNFMRIEIFLRIKFIDEFFQETNQLQNKNFLT